MLDLMHQVPIFDLLDFIGRYLRVQSENLSGTAFRKMCKNEFFHYLRVREWVDVGNSLLS